MLDCESKVRPLSGDISGDITPSESENVSHSRKAEESAPLAQTAESEAVGRLLRTLANRRKRHERTPSLSATLHVTAGRSTISARLHVDFGEIDIYLFDQLLRGRFDSRRRV